MERGPRNRGVTLVELAVALVVIGVLLGTSAGPFARALDRYAVRGARDALAAGLAHARSAAIANGGAELVIDLRAARYHIRIGGESPAPPVDLRAQYRVVVSADGQSADSIAFRFDALGIGRMTSRTIRFRRGHAEAGLTVATYGRVRRW